MSDNAFFTRTAPQYKPHFARLLRKNAEKQIMEINNTPDASIGGVKPLF